VVDPDVLAIDEAAAEVGGCQQHAEAGAGQRAPRAAGPAPPHRQRAHVQAQRQRVERGVGEAGAARGPAGVLPVGEAGPRRPDGRVSLMAQYFLLRALPGVDAGGVLGLAAGALSALFASYFGARSILA